MCRRGEKQNQKRVHSKKIKTKHRSVPMSNQQRWHDKVHWSKNGNEATRLDLIDFNGFKDLSIISPSFCFERTDRNNFNQSSKRIGILMRGGGGGRRRSTFYNLFSNLICAFCCPFVYWAGYETAARLTYFVGCRHVRWPTVPRQWHGQLLHANGAETTRTVCPATIKFKSSGRKWE